MKILVPALVLLLPAQAFAMPCDATYRCVSSSGRYQIELARCRYDNRLGNISALQVGGKELADARLDAAFDGDEFGGFEIDLGQQDPEHILSVEWAKKTGNGFIRDKSRKENPATFMTNYSEAISCKGEG